MFIYNLFYIYLLSFFYIFFRKYSPVIYIYLSCHLMSTIFCCLSICFIHSLNQFFIFNFCCLKKKMYNKFIKNKPKPYEKWRKKRNKLIVVDLKNAILCIIQYFFLSYIFFCQLYFHIITQYSDLFALLFFCKFNIMFV